MNDRSTELELLYIDDLIEEMLDALEGNEHHCEFDGVEAVRQENGRYCYTPVTHRVTLGEIVDLLEEFKSQPESLVVPEIPYNSFAKKLYSTYLSYLPKEKVSFPLKMNVDQYQQAGNHKGRTLAQQQVGVFYSCLRSWSYSRKKNGNR